MQLPEDLPAFPETDKLVASLDKFLKVGRHRAAVLPSLSSFPFDQAALPFCTPCPDTTTLRPSSRRRGKAAGAPICWLPAVPKVTFDPVPPPCPPRPFGNPPHPPSLFSVGLHGLLSGATMQPLPNNPGTAEDFQYVEPCSFFNPHATARAHPFLSHCGPQIHHVRPALVSARVDRPPRWL